MPTIVTVTVTVIVQVNMDINMDISKLYITLGYKCNMGCKYCSQTDVDKSHLAGASVNYTAIDAITKINDLIVVFFGGEPLLYLPEVFSIVEYVKQKNPTIKFGLITNGKNLSVELANKFNSYGISVTLSHDGYTQLQNRGYDPLVVESSRDAWLLLKDRNISTVISAKNPAIEKVWEYFDSFEEVYGNRQELIHVEWIKDAGGGVPDEFLMLNNKEFENSLDTLFSKVLTSIKQKDFNSRAFQFILPYIKGYLFRQKISKPVPSCGVNYNCSHMDIAGNLYKCHSSQTQIGTIEERGIIAGSDSPYLNLLCFDCELLPYCGGGCILPLPSKKKYECYMNKQLWGRIKELFVYLEKNPALCLGVIDETCS